MTYALLCLTDQADAAASISAKAKPSVILAPGFAVGTNMITAAEYRAWAEEFLRWAGEATTANERDAYIKTAEVWLQSALRSERLAKEPIPTTEWEWVLPPFQQWRRKGG